ncbi:MAG: ABC transporter ATP-binding protein [Ignavibacteriae bacterium]|nr:ABC transporter ATP-binding protein [Ignavibacteriota bacterium]
MNIIEFNNITKVFGKLVANDDISFSIRKNSVHCIVGENGAGKSTLMKILFGVYKQDKGEIKVNGNEVKFNSPLDAIKCKIGMLHQHFMLIDDFTVLENVILGSELTNNIRLDFDKSKKILNEYIKNYNLDLSLDKKISGLSISEQQKVEILKLLYRNSDIIIFDEPTAVLSPIEVIEFFKIIFQFKIEGKTIILITHKLNEVKEISDYVTVLRRGKSVYETGSETLNIKALSKEIVGNVEIKNEISEVDYNGDKGIIAELSKINLKQNKVSVLNDLEFKLRKGEIYGICGVEGNGQNEIIDVLCGINKNFKGNLDIKTHKISLVPDDRIKKGMIKEFTVGENLILKRKEIKKVNNKLLKKFAEDTINKYDVRLSDIGAPMESLSGGNQQKVIIAREIELDNELLIFSHPTRGVDIAASSFIHSMIIEQKKKGKSILLISSDLDELLNLSDKLGVINKGKIVAEFDKTQFDLQNVAEKTILLESIGKLMIGVTGEQKN